MAFDPNAFMQAAADPMPTQMEVIREGEFPFVMDGDNKMLIPKNLKGVSAKTGNAYDFWQIELVALCQDEGEKQRLGRQKLPVRMRINLDLDPNNGSLVVGTNKNVALGKLREALGQNKPGWSPSALLNAGPFIGKVAHTNGSDGSTYADIVRVTKIS